MKQRECGSGSWFLSLVPFPFSLVPCPLFLFPRPSSLVPRPYPQESPTPATSSTRHPGTAPPPARPPQPPLFRLLILGQLQVHQAESRRTRLWLLNAHNPKLMRRPRP